MSKMKFGGNGKLAVTGIDLCESACQDVRFLWCGELMIKNLLLRGEQKLREF